MRLRSDRLRDVRRRSLAVGVLTALAFATAQIRRENIEALSANFSTNFSTNFTANFSANFWENCSANFPKSNIFIKSIYDLWKIEVF
jgi:hypothetical protein